MLDELVPFEVAAPSAWACCSTPEKIFPRQCFERSFHFALDVRNAFEANDPAV